MSQKERLAGPPATTVYTITTPWLSYNDRDRWIVNQYIIHQNIL